MRLYHKCELLKKVDDDGILYGVFTFTQYPDEHHGEKLFYIDIEDDAIAENMDLDKDEAHQIIHDKLGNMSNDEYEAIYNRIIFEKKLLLSGVDEKRLFQIFSANNILEVDWDAQRIRSIIAKTLGYKAIKNTDEYVTSYLVLPGAEFSEIIFQKNFNIN